MMFGVVGCVMFGILCVSGLVDSEYSEEDEKERRQLIEQVFELQNTLDGLCNKCFLIYILN